MSPQALPCRIHPAVTHQHVARCAECLGPHDHGIRRGCYSGEIPVAQREVRWVCAETGR